MNIDYEIIILFTTLVTLIITTIFTYYFSSKSNNNQIKSQVYTNFFQLLDHKENLLSSENVYLRNIENEVNKHTEARAISIVVKRLFNIIEQDLEKLNNQELNNQLNNKILPSTDGKRSYNHKGIVNFKVYKYHKTIMSYLYNVDNRYKHKLIDIYFDTMTIKEKVYYLICDKNISESDVIDYNNLGNEITLDKFEEKLNKKLREYFYL